MDLPGIKSEGKNAQDTITIECEEEMPLSPEEEVIEDVVEEMETEETPQRLSWHTPASVPTDRPYVLSVSTFSKIPSPQVKLNCNRFGVNTRPPTAPKPSAGNTSGPAFPSASIARPPTTPKPPVGNTSVQAFPSALIARPPTTPKPPAGNTSVQAFPSALIARPLTTPKPPVENTSVQAFPKASIPRPPTTLKPAVGNTSVPISVLASQKSLQNPIPKLIPINTPVAPVVASSTVVSTSFSPSTSAASIPTNPSGIASTSTPSKPPSNASPCVNGDPAFMFVCPRCKGVFNTRFALDDHDLLCPGDVSNSSGEFNSGQTALFLTTPSLKPSCGICTKSFPTKKELEEHSTVHSLQRPFVCKFCKAAFKLERKLREHELLCTKRVVKTVTKKVSKAKVASKNKSPRINCPSCPAAFVVLSHMQRHVHMAHIVNRNKIKCNHCGTCFTQRGSLSVHLSGSCKVLAHALVGKTVPGVPQPAKKQPPVPFPQTMTSAVPKATSSTVSVVGSVSSLTVPIPVVTIERKIPAGDAALPSRSFNMETAATSRTVPVTISVTPASKLSDVTTETVAHTSKTTPLPLPPVPNRCETCGKVFSCAAHLNFHQLYDRPSPCIIPLKEPPLKPIQGGVYPLLRPEDLLQPRKRKIATSFRSSAYSSSDERKVSVNTSSSRTSSASSSVATTSNQEDSSPLTSSTTAEEKKNPECVLMCEVCKNPFRNKKNLMRHRSRNVCSQQKTAAHQLGCGCGIYFRGEKGIARHQKMTSCSIFSAESNRFQPESNRIQSEARPSPTVSQAPPAPAELMAKRPVLKQRCEICASLFPPKMLRRHKVSKICSKVRTIKHKFPCASCGIHFKSSRDVNTHAFRSTCSRPRQRDLPIPGASQNKLEPATCSVCHASMASLKIHIQKLVCSKVPTELHQYPCSKCGVYFKRRWDVLLHEQRRCCRSVEARFQCDLCKQCFKAPHLLRIHREAHFPNYKAFSCNTCGLVFSKKHILRAHVANAHSFKLVSGKEGDSSKKPSRNQCQTCKSMYVKRSDFRNHVERGVCSQIKSMLHPHQCDLCKVNFRESKVLQHHQKFCGKSTQPEEGSNAHLEPENDGSNSEGEISPEPPQESVQIVQPVGKIKKAQQFGSCSVCKSTFKSKKAFLLHFVYESCSLSLSKTHRFQCKICGVYFKSLSSRGKHFVRVHKRTVDRKSSLSSTTPNSLSTSSSLRASDSPWAAEIAAPWTNFISGPNHRVFPCPQCDVIFKQRAQLRQHLKRSICSAVRSPLHEHQCQNCGLYFRIDPSLQEHLKWCQWKVRIGSTHSDSQLLSTVPDPFDPKLRIEARVHLPRMPMILKSDTVLNSKKGDEVKCDASQSYFPCGYCDKVFHLNANKRSHEKIHLSEGKVTECPICGRTMSSAKKLERHMQSTISCIPYGTVGEMRRGAPGEQTSVPQIKTELQDVFVSSDTSSSNASDKKKKKKCIFCSERFCRSDLDDHLEKVRCPKTPTPNSKKPYMCGLCFRSFKYSQNLLSHVAKCPRSSKLPKNTNT